MNGLRTAIKKIVGTLMSDFSGRLIAFEGVDATGKTTLCSKLFSALTSRQQSARLFHFPGNERGTLGELVYRIHHDHQEEFGICQIDPSALQVLHIAAHIDAIQRSIKQSIIGGHCVILDRFWWSTYVYGLEAGVSDSSLSLMIELENQAWGSFQPDVMFFVDTSAPLSSRELGSESWQRKRQIYSELAERSEGVKRCVRVQTEVGEQGISQAMAAILSEIGKLGICPSSH